MKKLFKIGALALCLTVAVTAFAACGGKDGQNNNVSLTKTDLITAGGNAADSRIAVYEGANQDVSTRRFLTNAEAEALTVDGNGALVLNVANDVHEIEFDVIKLFEKTGFDADNYVTDTGFYFTRSDIDNKLSGSDKALLKGVTFVLASDTVNPNTWTCPALGVTEAASKNAIVAAKGEAAAVRLYYDTKYNTAVGGRARIYSDSTTASTLNTGTTEITYMFYGKDGKTADLKVKIIKAAAA